MFTRNREQAVRLLAEAIARQTEIDNLGDTESIVLVGKTPVLNLGEILDSIFADLEIEVEWEDED